MIYKELTENQCRATIACLEVRKMYLEKFAVYDKFSFTMLRHKLLQFGYSVDKVKTHECIFDHLTTEFNARIQHYECLQWLLSIEFNKTDYE